MIFTPISFNQYLNIVPILEPAYYTSDNAACQLKRFSLVFCEFSASNYIMDIACPPRDYYLSLVPYAERRRYFENKFRKGHKTNMSVCYVVIFLYVLFDCVTHKFLYTAT